MTNENGDSVTILVGDGNGGLRFESCVGATATPIGIEVADLNGDGASDIVVSTRSSNNVKTFLRRPGLLTTNYRPWDPDVNGTLNVQLNAGPAFAGQTYIIWYSLSGPNWTTSLGNVGVPIEYDLVPFISGNGSFTGIIGPLNGAGIGNASIDPSGYVIPQLLGFTVYIAAVWGAPGPSSINWTASASTIALPLL